jgi:hypothetical protein
MYKLQKDTLNNKIVSVSRLEDGASIPFDPDNTDYQAYLKWLSDGNIPHSADGTTNLTPLNREAE